MLKLLIADDEKIIRETICNFIDWEALGVDVVSVCSNGVEAYEAIMDYYPDIVLTDIKMPGLSGLELIEKIREIDESIQFIILSGHDNFDYAKKAMKFGVQHYLLKPCNENQIMDAIAKVKHEYFKQREVLTMQNQQQTNEKRLHEHVVKNLLFECISTEQSICQLIKNYERFIDFIYLEYRLYFLYYLEKKCLSQCLEQISCYFEKNHPHLAVHTIYVKNTLILFFPDCQTSYDLLEMHFSAFSFQGQTVSIELSGFSQKNLSYLLEIIVPKLRRYERIYFIEQFHSIELLNHSAFLKKIESCVTRLQASDASASALLELEELIASIADISFLKIISIDIILRFSTEAAPPAFSSDFLNETISQVNQMKSIIDLTHYVHEMLTSLMNGSTKNNPALKPFIDQALYLVDQNLSNPNLSLKWIAENHLYMNVDYLSKQFARQMGIKFSSYLATKRMEKAKELLLKNKYDYKISEIAGEVGCGDNPQYFSQLFKKYTGLSPSGFIKTLLP